MTAATRIKITSHRLQTSISQNMRLTPTPSMWLSQYPGGPFSTITSLHIKNSASLTLPGSVQEWKTKGFPENAMLKHKFPTPIVFTIVTW